MADVISILPLLNGWSWLRISGSEELSAGGQPINLYESEGPELGWLVGARLSSSVRDATLEVVYDPDESGQTLTYRLNPAELYSNGYVGRSNLPYVANYDEGANEYLAEFNPVPPLALKGTLYVRLLPGSGDGVARYDVQYLQITDVEAFVSSLRAALGIRSIADLLNSINQGQTAPPVIVPGPTISRYTGFLP